MTAAKSLSSARLCAKWSSQCDELLSTLACLLIRTEYCMKEFIKWLCRTRQQFIRAPTASVFTAWLVNFHQFGIAIVDSCVCHRAGEECFPSDWLLWQEGAFTRELWFLGLFQIWRMLNAAFSCFFFFSRCTLISTEDSPKSLGKTLLVVCGHG